MKALYGVLLVGLTLLACRQGAGRAAGAVVTTVIAIPRSDWQQLVEDLDASFERTVLDVEDGDRLVGIRYFCKADLDTKECVGGSPGGQLELVNGDRIVGVNGTRVSGPSANAKNFLHQQMLRSSKTCTLSLDIEAPDEGRTVAAHCG